MKNIFKLLAGLLALVLTMACGAINVNPDAKSITPSDNVITETRDVSGFTGVDMRTIGTVTITQGKTDSLVITGSDNLVELVSTRVEDGVLLIEMVDVNVQSLKKDNILEFAITVKNLASLTVSGLGTVEMNGLETKSLNLTMSGAGAIVMSGLKLETILMNISGVGGITVAGNADRAEMELSGAGELNAADLAIKTANVNLSGLGTAVLWVTDELTGTISGAGSVRYYGSPRANTNSTGVGVFEALGAK